MTVSTARFLPFLYVNGFESVMASSAAVCLAMFTVPSYTSV